MVFRLVVVFLSLVFKFLSIGCIVCIINGRLMNVSVIMIFSGVNVIFSFSGFSCELI